VTVCVGLVLRMQGSECIHPAPGPRRCTTAAACSMGALPGVAPPQARLVCLPTCPPWPATERCSALLTMCAISFIPPAVRWGPAKTARSW
jgi:hypothetical protein